MRIVGPLLGVMLGVLLGFGLHELVGSGGDRDTLRGAGRTEALAAAPVNLPAPRTQAAQPVVVPEAEPAPAWVAPTSGGVGAAADALVGILVHGAVLASDGKTVPPQDWGITFDDERREPQWTKVSPSSTYAISGLTPGRWTVRCGLPGYRETKRTLDLVATEPVVRLDLVLEPAVVLVIKAFTPEGKPLLDAIEDEMGGGEPWHEYRITAIATREPPPSALPEISYRSYTDWGIGSYADRLDSWRGPDDTPTDAMGRLQIDGALPAFVSLLFRHIVLQTQLAEPGATEARFVVSIPSLQALLGTVKLHVVSVDTKQPVAEMTASLSDSQSDGGGDKPDAAGNFVWERQRPGQLELQVSAPGHETLHGVVSVKPGATTDLGTLGLTAMATLRGRVVDAAGAPVAVSLRALIDEPFGGRGMGARRTFESDADGAFESYGLGRHRYHVAISSEDWAAFVLPVDLSNGDVSGLVIEVVQGTPVRLIPRWGDSRHYDVRVTRDDGALTSDVRGWDSDWTWFKRLVPGRYEVALLDDGRVVRQIPLLVGDSPVALELKP